MRGGRIYVGFSFVSTQFWANTCGLYVRRVEECAIPHFPEIVSRNPDVEFLFSMQILNTTHTNNNCGSVNGIFSDLELEGVQSILGKSLQADMAGYMQ